MKRFSQNSFGMKKESAPFGGTRSILVASSHLFKDRYKNESNIYGLKLLGLCCCVTRVCAIAVIMSAKIYRGNIDLPPNERKLME